MAHHQHRKFDGHFYTYDSRYGAYGGARRLSREAAHARAVALRIRGKRARVTLERQDYGSWWVVWVR